MKNFQNFTPQKYMTSDFQKISDGIYIRRPGRRAGNASVRACCLRTPAEIPQNAWGREKASR